jgi:hypothetical protein
MLPHASACTGRNVTSLGYTSRWCAAIDANRDLRCGDPSRLAKMLLSAAQPTCALPPSTVVPTLPSSLMDIKRLGSVVVAGISNDPDSCGRRLEKPSSANEAILSTVQRRICTVAAWIARAVATDSLGLLCRIKSALCTRRFDRSKLNVAFLWTPDRISSHEELLVDQIFRFALPFPSILTRRNVSTALE